MTEVLQNYVTRMWQPLPVFVNPGGGRPKPQP
jgi:hypothetical protein